MANFGGGYQQNGGSSFGSSNEFNRLTDTISRNTQKITSNVAQLNSWLALYGTRQETAELHDKLQNLQQTTNQLAKDTNKHVKDLGKLPLLSNPSEMRQQNAQRKLLVEEFMAVLNKFQSFQRQEKETERKSVAQARSSFGGSAVSYDLFAEGSPQDDFQYGGMTSQRKQTTLQIDVSDTDLEVVREREEALRKLESDIMDVNQIFKDLGALVHEQGDTIDSIQANVDSASISVTQGKHRVTEQLRQAENYQNESRRTKRCILIIVLVILKIAIIFGVTLSKK